MCPLRHNAKLYWQRKLTWIPCLWQFVCVLLFSLPQLEAAPATDEIITEKLAGAMLIKEGAVSFQAPAKPETLATVPQPLDLGDLLRTHELARASVRFADWSQLKMKPLTRLQIEPRPDKTNSPGINLLEGQIYISSRGGPQSIPIVTRHARGVPKGTEFLVSVDLQANRTEVTMFDGEVALSNPLGRVLVPSGWRGVAEAGQAPRLLARIEAQKIVQWWMYYPGLLDPEELDLPPAAQAQLAPSLEAYRQGDLAQALQKYPGYPNPPDPPTTAERKTFLCRLTIVVTATT